MNTPREVQSCNMSSLVSFRRERLARLVRVLDERLPARLRAPAGTLSVAVMDDRQIAGIHAEFLSDPTRTDVITFEGDPADGFAGEICVSAERALDMAARYSNTPDEELCLYVAHGMLHLAGVDDIAPEDAAKMRAAEAEALGIIKAAFRRPVFHFNA